MNDYLDAYTGYRRTLDPPTQDCITIPYQPTPTPTLTPTPTPNPVVTGISFERLQGDSFPIDGNPNIGDGQRVFPDDEFPGDTANRQTLRVTAAVSQQRAGINVYFQNFDLDDPSSDPIIDPNGNAANDNNGTPAAGQLNTTSASTNSSGVAVVEFTVTRQPGDNFAVAASTNPNERDAVTISGTDLINGSGQTIPTICGLTEPVCRSQMLTVWRRLHIEVDSMGESQQNFVIGTTTQIVRIRAGQQADIPITQSSGEPLEVNRFENGRIVINSRSYFVISNTENTVTVTGPSAFTTIFAGSMYQLFDDDDFNDDDGTNVDGDTGENILMPDTSLLMANSDDINTNVFASAYVHPVYDIGDNNDNTVFVANPFSYSPADLTIMYDFDQRATEASPKFWTVYLLGAYQGVDLDDADPQDEDGDGIVPDASYGITDNYPNGQGSSVFMEVSRPKEYPLTYASRPVSRAATAAHELGHLFGGIHEDEGLMQISEYRTEKFFRPAALAKIRMATNP